MNIRRAKQADLAAIVEIYNDEITHSTATFDTVPVTVESRRQWFEDHAVAKHPILVAEIDGAVGGWAALSPWSDRCAYARAAEVSVYVSSQHRRQGIGKALLRALIDHGRENGLGVLLARISCGEGPGSRKLHQSCGFELVGRMHRVGEKFGRILDVELLECHLDEWALPTGDDLLILIRHACPVVCADRPASQWELSEQGRRASTHLARRIASFGPRSIVSSVEPKAAETARLVAQALGITAETAPDLHEHARTTVPVFGSRGEFDEQIRRLFENPTDVVFGDESAVEARTRFQRAVQHVVESRTERGTVVIVAHGTVISLLAAEWSGRDPYEIWRRLGLPSFVVVSRAEKRLVQIVDTVDVP